LQGHDVVVTDAWGQTETGGPVLFNPPPAGPDTLPDPGVDIVDSTGQPVPPGHTGELVLQTPWPGLFCAVDGHMNVDERYWHHAGPDRPHCYATGDRARRIPGGAIEIHGRIDPVVKVSGQIVSLADIRDVLLEHPFVAEAEVVQTTSRGDHVLVAWVTLRPETTATSELADELRADVHEALGALSRPRVVIFAEELPAGVSAIDLADAFHHLPQPQAHRDTIVLAPGFRLRGAV
jgi:acetyl-CoA synthetase